VNISAEIESIQARINSLSSQIAAPTVPARVAAVALRAGDSQLVAAPFDPQAASRFQGLIANALSGGSETASSSGYAPIAPANLEPLINQNANAYGVDPSLIKAVIANESGFNAAATSPVGAQGLMQLMPSTAAGLGVQNSYDPAQNVAAGTRYLRGLFDRFGDWKLAVAAYNAGPEAVHRYGGIPPYRETQAYVSNVFSSLRNYQTTQ
jgi:soluble lytic murein transglycosylase-like protein